MKWLVMVGLALLVACKPDAVAVPSEPVRIAITVTDEGYSPSAIAVTPGTPVTLVFTRTTTTSCLDKVLIPSQHIEKELPVNQPVEVTFTPKEAGMIEWTCGMEMFKGEISVHGTAHM